jgi:Na+-translocating ferredoxin:NAD+ oxidoreductase RnfE subunit
LPPGAFITLGLLIAARNWIVLRGENKTKEFSSTAIPAV